MREHFVLRIIEGEYLSLIHIYKVNGEYGSIDVKQVNNTCCLGYEDIFGNKYDMMDNVDCLLYTSLCISPSKMTFAFGTDGMARLLL